MLDVDLLISPNKTAIERIMSLCFYLCYDDFSFFYCAHKNNFPLFFSYQVKENTLLI